MACYKEARAWQAAGRPGAVKAECVGRSPRRPCLLEQSPAEGERGGHGRWVWEDQGPPRLTPGLHAPGPHGSAQGSRLRLLPAAWGRVRAWSGGKAT